MRQIQFYPTFSIWQQFARSALQLHWQPNELIWNEKPYEQSELTLFNNADLLNEADAQTSFLVPRDFVQIAKRVACHRPPAWSLLYHILWRLTHGEPYLLKISTDPLIRELEIKDKAVRHEIHKMRAFIRFKEVVISELSQSWYVAWFEPKHHILEMNGNFFRGRFASMTWFILTPYRCMHWDQQQLLFTDGVSQPSGLNDEVEKLWKTYYANIFNPARIKVKTMQKEMPRYYWKNLPETSIISQLLQKAHPRVNKMMLKSHAKTIAESDLAPVPNSNDWNLLKRNAETCRACPLWRNATQTVFGEGAYPARIMLVGEQPGEQEDVKGKPFVGPAGQLLARALEQIKIDRNKIYVTNAVKHFKWTPKGKRRIHKKPNIREIAACWPWLEAELKIVQPEFLVCLGATAAYAVLGSGVKVMRDRGKFFESPWTKKTLVTIHPSALLRLPTEVNREAEYQRFVDELSLIRD